MRNGSRHGRTSHSPNKLGHNSVACVVRLLLVHIDEHATEAFADGGVVHDHGGLHFVTMSRLEHTEYKLDERTCNEIASPVRSRGAGSESGAPLVDGLRYFTRLVYLLMYASRVSVQSDVSAPIPVCGPSVENDIRGPKMVEAPS